MTPISNEVKVQSLTPKEKPKVDSPSPENQDSIDAVTSALKANEAAFKGQLPESLRGTGDVGEDGEEEKFGEERPVRLLQDPFEEEPHLSGRRPRPSAKFNEPQAITGQSEIFTV